jgi:hypothetical protein
MKLAGSLEAAPNAPETPPLVTVATERIPPEMVVAPVWLFVPESAQVLLPLVAPEESVVPVQLVAVWAQALPPQQTAAAAEREAMACVGMPIDLFFRNPWW